MNSVTDKMLDNFYGEYALPPKRYEKNTNRIKRRKFMIKTDCFAYKKRMCSVLTEMVCRYGCCSFYKTKAQDASDRIKYKTNEKYSQKGALK